jgi:hypothetical protein
LRVEIDDTLARIRNQTSASGRHGLRAGDVSRCAGTDLVINNSMSSRNSAMAIGFAMKPSHPLARISSSPPLYWA